MQPKIAGGGGGVRGSVGHPAADGEKGHLLAKRVPFSHDYRGAGLPPPPPPRYRYGPALCLSGTLYIPCVDFMYFIMGDRLRLDPVECIMVSDPERHVCVCMCVCVRGFRAWVIQGHANLDLKRVCAREGYSRHKIVTLSRGC